MRGSTAVIESNVCFQNFYAGIGHSGASPLVVKNRCYENIRAGIGISEGAKPVVRGNQCYRNRRAGIGIRTGAETSPLVEDNDCHHNDMAGIGFDECRSGSSDLLNNRVIDNDKVAIGIHAGWKVRLVSNELSRKDGLPPLVMVFKGAEADFIANTLRGSGVAGIRTEGIVRATGNTIDCPQPRVGGGPPQFGVWGLPGSETTLAGNTITGWRQAVASEKATLIECGNRLEKPVAP